MKEGSVYDDLGADAQSLSRGSLADQIAQKLLDYIVNKGLEPGTRLPSEQDLAGKFEVSRPVVREALRSLAGQRIIQIVNGRGAVVSPLSGHSLGVFFQRAVQMDEASMEELMEARRCLELPTARFAAERRDSHDLRAIADIVAKMHAEEVGPEAYIALDVAFHMAMARAAHNTILYHVITSIRSVLDEVIGAVFHGHPPEVFEEVKRESRTLHEAILEAIVEKDVDAAEHAMVRHLAHAQRTIALHRDL